MTQAAPRLRQLRRIDEIPAAAWDALFPSADPFVRHDFLAALERHGCVGGETGWAPCHLVLEDDGGRPAAAAPLYAKSHSWGEFVFDFSWARASAALGVPYYPKLVSAVPFTPVSGSRIGARDPAAARSLAHALAAAPAAAGCSSLHLLFPQEREAALLRDHGLLERHDLQYHWFNRSYEDFEAFLSALAHEPRKKIRRERRRIAEHGLRFEWRRGEELGEPEWAEVYAMYANTYEERGQPPYLNLDFFLDYGARPGSPVRLILALEGRRRVAVAITLAAGDTLYGRHWGCREHYDSLHFETCYYQGIELCIREGLMRFDAGAQGEHKRPRGFEPVLTRSMHAIRHPPLRQAVAGFLARERAAIAEHQEALAARSPYRRKETGHG